MCVYYNRVMRRRCARSITGSGRHGMEKFRRHLALLELDAVLVCGDVCRWRPGMRTLGLS